MSIILDVFGSNPIFVIFVLILLFIFYSLYVQYLCDTHLPPKVRGFPVFGILPYMLGGKPLERLCREWRDKYGDVFTIYLGNRPMVVLASYDSIRDTIKKQPESYSCRPNIYTLYVLSGGGQGIILHQYGDSWKEVRKFSLQVLKDFGVGKTSLEEKILEEIEVVRSEIIARYSSGREFNPQMLMQSAVSNIICNINFGSRYEYTNPEFQKVMATFAELARIIGSGGIVDLYPCFRYLPVFNKSINTAINLRDIVHDYVRKQIQEHKTTFDSKDIRDFIDIYLKVAEEGNLTTAICESQIFHVIVDMFAAGTETTSTTLLWCFLYLCHYPHMQTKIHEELDTAFGTRYARLTDKGSVPFTNAFLLEVQRHVTIVPMGVPHSVAKDVQFHEYQIGKGTGIFTSLYCAHRDEKYFPDSDIFNPNRWLNSDGKLINNEAFIPFSTGHRICIGEQLAKMELFLFFTGLLQTFKISASGDLPAISGSTSNTTIRGPQPYKITMKKR